MKIIGKKLNVMYLLFYILIPSLIMLVSSIVFIINNGFSFFKILFGVIGVYGFGVGFYLAFLPQDLIAIDKDNVILLRNNQIIKISEIIKVKFKRVSNNMILFSFGTLIIETENGLSYRQDFLSNPRHIANELINIMK